MFLRCRKMFPKGIRDTSQEEKATREGPLFHGLGGEAEKKKKKKKERVDVEQEEEKKSAEPSRGQVEGGDSLTQQRGEPHRRKESKRQKEKTPLRQRGDFEALQRRGRRQKKGVERDR